MSVGINKRIRPTLYELPPACNQPSVLTGRTLGAQFGDSTRIQLILAVVVVLAVESFATQRKLVTGHQVFGAHAAPEAVDVEDLISGPHHHVRAAERFGALAALGAEQPGTGRHAECQTQLPELISDRPLRNQEKGMHRLVYCVTY